MVNEADLLTYCDATGYLSNAKRAEYLQSLGLVKVKKNDFAVIYDKIDEWKFADAKIDSLLTHIAYKRKGSMGVTTNKDETITADEIDI